MNYKRKKDGKMKRRTLFDHYGTGKRIKQFYNAVRPKHKKKDVES